MNKTDILKKYVCKQPFTHIDIQHSSQWICCPSWAPTNIRVDKDDNPVYYTVNNETENLMRNWKGKSALQIRQSVVDGSYSHCDHKVCPSLSKLINTGIPDYNFIKKEEFQEANFQTTPETILFGFDRSCNLKCPSCRSELVANDDQDSKEFQSKLFLLSQIEEHFSKSAKILSITGSGDPFYSKLYRDYLINFDVSKYPSLEVIQIITNGILLTEKMWNSLNCKQLIKHVGISVDAGCKETYENVTRLNGNWDKLIENLKFLGTQDEIIKYISCSMVVSQYNYKEMKLFYDVMYDIFKNSKVTLNIDFTQIIHWNTGAYSIKDISKISVFDPKHPKFENFLIELKKISNLENVSHNFHHLL